MSHPELMLLERLNAIGERAPSLDEKVHMAEAIRALPDAGQRLDRMLIGDRDRLRAGLQEAQSNLQELKRLLDKMTAPPWHTGLFLCRANRPEDELGEFPELAELTQEGRVMVRCASDCRVVSVGDDVDISSLALGDTVLLNSELTVVIGKRPTTSPAWARRPSSTATPPTDASCSSGATTN